MFKNLKMRELFSAIMLIAFVWTMEGLFCGTVYAVPMTTNYQGFLKDASDKPMNDTVSLTFSLYDVAANGTPMWSETQNVAVENGYFSVVLGSTTNFSENVTKGTLYLGIKVGENAEMTPRQEITSSFFAMRAGIAETVADGAVKTEDIAPGAVTSEKVADGSVSSVKLAASAVTGDKLAPNAITADKLANGTVTLDKLALEVQQKLNQPISSPLNVEQLKVGKNSMYLGPLATGGIDNSIYTDNGALLVQSKSANNQNTVINADNTGKVGIGTTAPKAKLEVNGIIKASPGTVPSDFFSAFGEGLYMSYDKDDGGDIGAINTSSYPPAFKKLFLSGNPILLNATNGGGNVGIGTATPKSKLDVAGSVAIGSGYAGTQTAPPNGLIVEGSVQIGVNTDTPTTKLQVGCGIMKTVIGSAYGDKTVSWGQAYIRHYRK